MSTRELTYRKLAEEDLGAVAALEALSFPTPWTAEQYALLLGQGGCVLFGALAEGFLAGYIAVGMQSAVGEMEVYNIAVANTFRRQGVGKRLLRLTLEAALRSGVEQAILEVRVSNLPALALYRSLGFFQVGVRKGYYHDTGEDGLVLALPLSGGK